MSVQYSCIWCGDDVDETAATIYCEDMDYDMPICDGCNEEDS